MDELCKNFEVLEGCGKCKIQLTETQKIKYITPISMCDIVDVLLTICIRSRDKMIVLKYCTITCRGDIEIVYGNEEKGDYAHYNMKICRKLISSWYHYHKIVLYEAISLIYMSRVVSILGTIAPINELTDRATKLNDVLNELMD